MQEFFQATGPTMVPDTMREVFMEIFNHEIVDYIVQETNRYACSVMGEARYEKWETVKREDLHAYFGIMVMMGLVDLPCLQDYWKRDPLFYCPFIAERMARDRFLNIHKYLHFVDNDTLVRPGEPHYDRLCKVRPIFEMIEVRFVFTYQPHQECAINEAMVPYKRRSSLKQHMPKKMVRRGLKVWMRSDSTSGFVSQYQVYVGKEVSSETGLERGWSKTSPQPSIRKITSSSVTTFLQASSSSMSSTRIVSMPVVPFVRAGKIFW